MIGANTVPGKIEILKRWINMINGKSVFHMRQCEGKFYRKGEIAGYYSDLRHKVTGTLVDKNGVPYNVTSNGDNVYFPITIFQYGLGAYDMYLETRDNKYIEKFMNVVRWSLENQNADGSWRAFHWLMPDKPFSSMAQSEGVSLLCRAYTLCGDEQYIQSAKKAINFMLLPIENGGTAYYKGSYITFEESAKVLTVLNGMIFSIWGLYEICILTDDEKLKATLDISVKTVANLLARYDRGYWSNYDLNGHIASPFYHDLHIEQLKVMYKLFGIAEFKDFCEKWKKYQSSAVKPKMAFAVKAIQKLKNINNEVVIIQ